MRNIIIRTLLFFVFYSTLVFADIRCEKEADELVTNAQNWDQMLMFFNKYSSCDDGYIAEGVSDKIVKLLGEQGFDKILDITKKNPQIIDFIVRHIDETTDYDELRKVYNQAKDHCPKTMVKTCNLICSKIDDMLKRMDLNQRT